MTANAPARLGVLLSGSGRTLLNLLERIRRGELDAEIVGVIASRECRGLDRAREAGLAAQVIPGDLSADVLADWCRRLGIEWVVLAGYLRRLEIPPHLRGRVVNIHPALLPGDGTGGRFGGRGMYGIRVHEAVLAAGERESGCTVHLCDAEYDAGPIVLQCRCPVLPGDTPETLAARVFELELEAYPRALQLLINASRTDG